MQPTNEKNTQSTFNPGAVKKQLRGLLWMLGLQFVAGAALATIAGAEPDEKSPSIWHTGVLVVHVAIALGLLVGAIMLFARLQTVRQKAWNVVGIGGLISIIVALGGGVFTLVGPFNDFFAFVMSLGFICAAALYIKGFVLASRTPQS